MKNIRPIFTLLFSLIFGHFAAFAQLNDDFTDGDFTANPAWTGDATLFQINASQELQSNGNAATDTIYLSTPNTLIDDIEWRLTFHLTFAPSTQNYARVYLVSNTATLQGSVNGYYLQVGETGSTDVIRLFRQDGASSTLLAAGTTNVATNPNVEIKVTRTAAGHWTVFSAPAGNTTYTSECSATDATYTTTSHFGVYILHTTTNKNKHFFDNFFIGVPTADTTPPAIFAANTLSNNQLEVTFNEEVEQTSAETTSNYNVSNGIGTPTQATKDAVNGKLVHLLFGTNFPANTNLTLSATNVKDLNNNAITTPETIIFMYSVATQNQYKDLIFNEILSDPSPQIGLPNAEFFELYNRTNSPINLNGWKISDGTSTGIFPSYILQPADYVIVTASASNALFSTFGNVVSPSSFPSLNNSGDNLGLRDNNGILIDSVQYLLSWFASPTKAAGGWSLELKNPISPCFSSGNWVESEDVSGGTPSKQNSIYSTAPDNTPPIVANIQVIAPDSIRICFNESMSAATLSDVSHYNVGSGIGTPTFAKVSTDNQCVTLALSTNITTGVYYQISFSNLTDCSGNPLGTVAMQFAQGIAPHPFELTITEIYADYNPTNGLPLAEYVEVYNNSTKVLDISNYHLNDASSSSSPFGAITLAPNEYAIICSDANKTLFQGMGTVIPVSTLPSLNDDSDSLYLQDDAQNTIDYVFYNSAWYKDDAKTGGGWSLEKIDVAFVNCNNEGNWHASVNPLGGTPAKINSVNGTFADAIAPTVTGISIINTTTLEVFFSEPMDGALLEQESHYSMNNGLTLSQAISSLGNQKVTLYLNTNPPINPQTLYTLTINGLTDCAGNTVNSATLFGTPEAPNTGEVLINEILYNPYTNGSDFVEIYNNSNKVLDLSQISIGEIFEGTDSIFNARPIAANQILLLPHQLLCLTSDIDFQKNTYNTPDSAHFFFMSSLPSYDDTKGEVVIFTINQKILDRFKYEEDYHYPVVQEGVSWERINLNAPTQQAKNWQSPSFSVNYATPGYHNSKPITPQVPSKGEVLINEILFNPYTGGNDFVEIVNISNKTLDLSNLRIAKRDLDTKEITSIYAIFGEKDYLSPNEILAISTNSTYLKETYHSPDTAKLLEINSLPSYDDSEGECVIMTNTDSLLDDFHYFSSYHFASISDENGISLERISVKRPTNESDNWHSAASTVFYASPGYANSQRADLQNGTQTVTLEYELFTPNGDGDKDVLPINFKFDFQGANARVNIYDQEGRHVRILEKNQLLGTEPGTFFWDGTNDSNQKVSMGIYVVLLEVQDSSNGKKYLFRNACVVGDKL